MADSTLEVLWQDGERLYARVWRDGADGTRHECLAVTYTRDDASPARANRLAHEYKLQEHLEASWAVRPVDLVRRHGQPMLLLESLPGEPLDHVIDGPMDLARFLAIAVAVSAAIGRLHGSGLVHKDIKPANILVDVTTGRAWLTGFGIASRQPREHQAPEPPETIAGTLPYMAPEQTGRMNRSIDSRSDLYSLGVTLYEALTGALPFEADYPLEWVHCHVARRPVAPVERRPEVPAAVSSIIMKLLAKTPEERYQTAAGVERDLRRCQRAWRKHRRIETFELGRADVPERLKIPEKLYGRDAEVRQLIATFDRVVSRGTIECVLVSGYGGIGKSSLVNELLKALIPSRGLFAAGKFDQLTRNIPYATLAEAFTSLVRHILIGSDAELQSWRTALTEALGHHGALIAKLVPEIERVIGEQPPIPDLPAQEARNRFQHVLKQFIGVFARSGHPLVLFLDDLQWQDGATLDALQYLLTHPDSSHLLIIGAYRDNEIGPAHPLTRMLEGIRQSLPNVQEIALAPIRSQDVEALIADTLHVQPLAARPLAQLTYEKAGGNPFFTTQFLTMLAEERLLSFETRSAAWRWDLDRIREKDYTDNVAALMSGRLTRLSARTQAALRHLACLSHNAELATLAMILGESADTTELMLVEAVQAGLVLAGKRAFNFLHDRVREAAYALIPERERSAMHLRIARILEAQTAPAAVGDHIFEIVNHYNRGVSLLQGTQEQDRVAALNLEAALRARESSAYGVARSYLTAGRELLPPGAWKRHYTLTFSLELHGAECEILAGELKVAEDRLQTLSLLARSAVDRAAVTCQQITLYTALDRTDKAIAACFTYLRGVGIDWSVHPTPADFQEEYERIRRRRANRSIEEFASLPLCQDKNILATLNVLTTASTAASYFDNNLSCLMACRMVNLSLEHGNSDAPATRTSFWASFSGPGSAPTGRVSASASSP